MTEQMPKDFVDSLTQEPDDLQICECWDADKGQAVFAQWLGGARRFFDVDVVWIDAITHWKPQL